MRILFYDDEDTGHHIEFIHHYYMGALEHKEHHFFFCVPPTFEQRKLLYEWPHADNISFVYLSESEVQEVSHGGLFSMGMAKSRLLCNKVQALNVEQIFLTTLTYYIPFLCLFLTSRVKVSGILYHVYLYKLQQWSKARAILEKMRFYIATHAQCIENIYILNDEESARELNQIYATSKFRFLPDPVPVIPDTPRKNLRKELGISPDTEIYLHFGGLAERKGTLEILKAIGYAEHGELANKAFIFAGKIYDEIKMEFYALLENAQKHSQLIVFDGFCPYQQLYDLCHTADCILMPYQCTDLSSGVLGYASFFDKMVIGPEEGLVGKLIRKHHLGITIDDVYAKGIYKILTSEHSHIHSKEYAIHNHLNRFNTVIFDAYY